MSICIVEKGLIQPAFVVHFRPNRVSFINQQINNEPVVSFFPCRIYSLSAMYNSILRVTFPGCQYNELHFFLSAVTNSDWAALWAGAGHNCASAPHKAPLFQAGGYTRTELSLLDHSCKARMNGTHFILESSLNKCGTRTAYILNKIVYFNSVSILQRGSTFCTAHCSSTRKPL